MKTKNNRDSDRESQRPYTPMPPQHMDPSTPPKEVSDRQQKAKNQSGKRAKEPATFKHVERERQQKPHLLGESEPEIDDETTI